MKRWTRKTTWRWTNWTFGVWWSKERRRNAIGVDLGPLEVVWYENLTPVPKWFKPEGTP